MRVIDTTFDYYYLTRHTVKKIVALIAPMEFGTHESMRFLVINCWNHDPQTAENLRKVAWMKKKGLPLHPHIYPPHNKQHIITVTRALRRRRRRRRRLHIAAAAEQRQLPMLPNRRNSSRQCNEKPQKISFHRLPT
jgi:hypothetical protein